MMQAALPRAWIVEFERAARMRREEAVDREKVTRHDVRERERRAGQAEAKQEFEGDVLIEVILAAPDDVAAFRVDLDTYDAGTVEALMDNRQALDAVRDRIDAMLGEATILPDGRRVFKTRDGERVFDEHGTELASEVIDPSGIADTKPTWEAFQAETAVERSLLEEGHKLASYQRKLDEARERVDEGEITAKELDALKAELEADMPEAVRGKLNLDAADPRMGIDRDGRAAAAPLPSDMDALMRQTGLSPAPAP